MDEHTATVKGMNLTISRKFAVEVARFIRGKELSAAKKMLEGVVHQTLAVPFHRYNFDLGHKRGAKGPGRYPKKAARALLQLLCSAEANAENKGLDTASLYVARALVHKGNTVSKPGRHRGRRGKRTHVELVLAEREKRKEKEKTKKETK